MPNDPDTTLLWRFVQGERDAFESLFRQFEGEVFRWVLRIVRDPSAAEDVVVEVFWRAYRARARFDVSRPLGAWLRRIATNAALDHLRRSRGRAGWQALDEEVAATEDPDRAVRECVFLAFRKLPPKLQVVAILALVEERSHVEIADALGLPVGTVKSRVFRATRLLRTELGRMGVRP
jgi:RNA polymerase sigma factor (sigma-70 family)